MLTCFRVVRVAMRLRHQQVDGKARHNQQHHNGADRGNQDHQLFRDSVALGIQQQRLNCGPTQSQCRELIFCLCNSSVIFGSHEKAEPSSGSEVSNFKSVLVGPYVIRDQDPLGCYLRLVLDFEVINRTLAIRPCGEV